MRAVYHGAWYRISVQESLLERKAQHRTVTDGFAECHLLSSCYLTLSEECLTLTGRNKKMPLCWRWHRKKQTWGWQGGAASSQTWWGMQTWASTFAFLVSRKQMLNQMNLKCPARTTDVLLTVQCGEPGPDSTSHISTKWDLTRG